MISAIRACVDEEFEQVNSLIVSKLVSQVDLVENIGQYIVEAGGKRLRPLSTLLTAKALGDVDQKHIIFAAVVEFIHTATLLHDDVVDLSTLRRGRPTANSEFGNASSVLVGDFLYTRAFQLMVELDNMSLLDLMANTTNQIAEGEVMQLVRAGDPETTEQQYYDVITRKTAVLFAAACQGAAMLSGVNAAAQLKAREIGLNLGIAFQLIDDVLDYQGDPRTTGKNVGADLQEGKPTLPLIHVIANGTESDRSLVAASLKNKDASALTMILDAVRRSGGIAATLEAATKHRERALQALKSFTNTSAKNSLEDLARFSINRNY